jgi:hypothetical protein
MITKATFACTLVTSLSLFSTAYGQPPRFGPPTPFPTPVYRTDPVARYLSLQDRQVDEINQLTAGLLDRYQPRYDSIKGLFQDQYLLARKELDREYVRDWIDGARVILDDIQYGRYQHYLEERGVFNTAFKLPEPPKPAEKQLGPVDLRESPGTLREPSYHRPYYVPPER